MQCSPRHLISSLWVGLAWLLGVLKELCAQLYTGYSRMADRKSEPEMAGMVVNSESGSRDSTQKEQQLDTRIQRELGEPVPVNL